VGEAQVILLCQEVAPEELARRLAARRDHFFPPSLLASQLRDFEPPQPDELAVYAPAQLDPAAAARFCAAAAA
jgi:gluconokinase